MDSIMTWWGDIAVLRSASTWLQWVSIGLVFCSGFLQVGKYLIDKRERQLAAIAQAEQLNPAAQPIRTGTVTIEVVAQSTDQINATFMDRGGYVAFGNGNDALLVLSGTESRAAQDGQGEVVWRGVFEMDVSDPSVGKPVRYLLGAEYLQINFAKLPQGTRIKRGIAVVTINSAVRLEIPVPEQQMSDDRIFVRGLQPFLESLK